MNARIYTVKRIISYAISKRKTKIKTLNEIGIANGIYYPTTNIIKGILSEKDNYKVIIFLICLLFAFSFYANEVKNTFATKNSYISR